MIGRAWNHRSSSEGSAAAGCFKAPLPRRDNTGDAFRNAEPDREKRGLLARYDLNHHGEFDPDERETMLADRRYIDYAFPEID